MAPASSQAAPAPSPTPPAVTRRRPCGEEHPPAHRGKAKHTAGIHRHAASERRRARPTGRRRRLRLQQRRRTEGPLAVAQHRCQPGVADVADDNDFSTQRAIHSHADDAGRRRGTAVRYQPPLSAVPLPRPSPWPSLRAASAPPTPAPSGRWWTPWGRAPAWGRRRPLGLHPPRQQPARLRRNLAALRRSATSVRRTSPG